MNELETALTAAIKATREARTAIHLAAGATDDEACQLIKVGLPLNAAVAGIHEGELMGYANMLSSMLTAMRAMRKEAVIRKKAAREAARRGAA